MRRFLTIALAVLAVAGCANPDRIDSIDYPDEKYQTFSCVELANEHVRLTNEVMSVTGRRTAGENQAIYLTRRILFLPILFVMENSEENFTRVATLKGQYEAVERVAEAKDCQSGASGTSAD